MKSQDSGVGEHGISRVDHERQWLADAFEEDVPSLVEQRLRIIKLSIRWHSRELAKEGLSLEQYARECISFEHERQLLQMLRTYTTALEAAAANRRDGRRSARLLHQNENGERVKESDAADPTAARQGALSNEVLLLLPQESVHL